jgi:hypothetical protein
LVFAVWFTRVFFGFIHSIKSERCDARESGKKGKAVCFEETKVRMISHFEGFDPANTFFYPGGHHYRSGGDHHSGSSKRKIRRILNEFCGIK